MRFGLWLICGALATAVAAEGAQAQQINLSDAARLLAPGGNTIAGPGVFNMDVNQGTNVVDLSTVPDTICASVLALSGTVEITLLDAASVSLESATALATQGGAGGLFAGATACAANTGHVSVKCAATSTEPCKGAWRADRK